MKRYILQILFCNIQKERAVPDRFEMVHAFVKPLMDGLPPPKREALRSVVARRCSPPPTGEQLKIYIFEHVTFLAENAGLRRDPIVIAEAITKGDLPIE